MASNKSPKQAEFAFRYDGDGASVSVVSVTKITWVTVYCPDCKQYRQILLNPHDAPPPSRMVCALCYCEKYGLDSYLNAKRHKTRRRA